MRLEKLLWTFPIALTLHNLEEVVWLPAWSQRAGFWELPVGPTEFRVAAILLVILAYAVTYWSIRTGKEAFRTHVMAGFVFAMLLNVINLPQQCHDLLRLVFLHGHTSFAPE